MRGRYTPKFEGSKDYKVVPVPFISASFFNDYVHIGPTGLLVDLCKVDNVKVSAKGGIEFGRDEDDSDHLDGLGTSIPLQWSAASFPTSSDRSNSVPGSTRSSAAVMVSPARSVQNIPILQGSLSSRLAFRPPGRTRIT